MPSNSSKIEDRHQRNLLAERQQTRLAAAQARVEEEQTRAAEETITSQEQQQKEEKQILTQWRFWQFGFFMPILTAIGTWFLLGIRFLYNTFSGKIYGEKNIPPLDFGEKISFQALSVSLPIWIILGAVTLVFIGVYLLFR